MWLEEGWPKGACYRHLNADDRSRIEGGFERGVELPGDRRAFGSLSERGERGGLPQPPVWAQRGAQGEGGSVHGAAAGVAGPSWWWGRALLREVHMDLLGGWSPCPGPDFSGHEFSVKSCLKKEP